MSDTLQYRIRLLPRSCSIFRARRGTALSTGAQHPTTRSATQHACFRTAGRCSRLDVLACLQDRSNTWSTCLTLGKVGEHFERLRLLVLCGARLGGPLLVVLLSASSSSTTTGGAAQITAALHRSGALLQRLPGRQYFRSRSAACFGALAVSAASLASRSVLTFSMANGHTKSGNQIISAEPQGDRRGGWGR